MKIQPNPCGVIWSAFSTYVSIVYRQIEKRKLRRTEPINKGSDSKQTRDSTQKLIDLLV